MITLCPTCGRCSPTETSFGTCRCPSARVQHQLLHQFTGLLNVQSGTCYAGVYLLRVHGVYLPSQVGAAHGMVLLANAHVSRRTVLHMLPPSQMGAEH